MIKCIAVDDEPLALDVIEHFIKKMPGFILTARCNSALEAMEVLNKEEIDLMFLDIQMPELTGVQFLKTLSNPPSVIFTTAYENYALEGFNLDVIDYLLKPIPFDRFVKAANKAKEIIDLKQIKNKDAVRNKEFMFVRSDLQTVKIIFNDILYIEGLKDYVKIFCGPKPIFVHQNLKSIEDNLPSGEFIRVHKSYIISIKHMTAVQKNTLFINEIEIPIGDSYKDQVNRVIQEGK